MHFKQNPIYKGPAEPEFQVTRNDSIAQVAKENTYELMQKNGQNPLPDLSVSERDTSMGNLQSSVPSRDSINNNDDLNSDVLYGNGTFVMKENVMNGSRRDTFSKKSSSAAANQEITIPQSDKDNFFD